MIKQIEAGVGEYFEKQRENVPIGRFWTGHCLRNVQVSFFVRKIGCSGCMGTGEVRAVVLPTYLPTYLPIFNSTVSFKMQDGGGGEGESSKSKQITNGLDAYLYTYLHSLCLSLYLSHTHTRTHYLGIRCRLSVCGSVTILFGPTATTAPLPGVVCVSKASWDDAKMDSQASWLVELPMSAVPTVAAHRNLALKVRILTLLKLSISFWSIQFGYYLPTLNMLNSEFCL